MCLLAAMLFAPAVAPAGQPPPDYGLDWVTIGDPGNRATLPHETPDFLPGDPPIGAVPYKYRMARTEMTVGQWHEFVLAYAPYHQGNPGEFAFTGPGTFWNGFGYAMVQPPNWPARMSFEYAARLANWYMNGKVDEAWAFESGAYDTSTFYVDDDGIAHHQAERSPGALFWIPSLDEWTKASHWSPADDRYWYRQGSQDEPLVIGLPSEGGETNAGTPPIPWAAVGGYPHVTSPWGLLDTSGSVFEMTETVPSPNLARRYFRGSARGVGQHDQLDALDALPSSSVYAAIGGIRLASAVPSPSAAVALGLFGFAFVQRRR